MEDPEHLERDQLLAKPRQFLLDHHVHLNSCRGNNCGNVPRCNMTRNGLESCPHIQTSAQPSPSRSLSERHSTTPTMIHIYNSPPKGLSTPKTDPTMPHPSLASNRAPYTLIRTDQPCPCAQLSIRTASAGNSTSAQHPERHAWNAQLDPMGALLIHRTTSYIPGRRTSLEC
jgi:hypothetical protein